jgi:hypothetical protein
MAGVLRIVLDIFDVVETSYLGCFVYIMQAFRRSDPSLPHGKCSIVGVLKNIFKLDIELSDALDTDVETRGAMRYVAITYGGALGLYIGRGHCS